MARMKTTVGTLATTALALALAACSSAPQVSDEAACAEFDSVVNGLLVETMKAADGRSSDFEDLNEGHEVNLRAASDLAESDDLASSIDSVADAWVEEPNGVDYLLSMSEVRDACGAA